MTFGSASFGVWYLVLLLGFCSGCAGYKVGPTSGVEAGEKSIKISPVENHTVEPRLGEYVSSALRRNLQQEGTFKLSTHGDANVVVTADVKSFNRDGISFVPNDVATVHDYLINIVARVTAIESNGKTLLDRDVSGHTTVRVVSDVSSAERQAIPLLADDLARNITSLLVDGDW